MKQFRIELKRFTELDITDEDILRSVLQRLVEQVQIQENVSIIIHYNFRNPLVQGAWAPSSVLSIICSPHMSSVWLGFGAGNVAIQYSLLNNLSCSNSRFIKENTLPRNVIFIKRSKT